MIKTFFFVCIFSFCTTNGQNLKKIPLTNAEKKKRVLSKYTFDGRGEYVQIVLLLYGDGIFQYSMSSFNREALSSGKWKFEKGMLILNSDIKRDNLPVKISYSLDTTSRINGCKFNSIKNLSGEEVSDAFVLINNDTTRCLPSYSSCYGNYFRIDSIKVLLESGISSGWFKLKSITNLEQVDINIEMNILPSMYYVIDNRKYKMINNRLIKQK
jgi:hypothetical protein